MVLNYQKRIGVDLDGLRGFVRKVRSALKLGRREFNVCLVDDARIADLNGRYRHKARPTDVLSFPWNGTEAPGGAGPGRLSRLAGKSTGARFMEPRPSREFDGFLGDIVISAETARRNARAAGHSTAREIRWLILHGVLHLLGFDHETDAGEMTALESSLRMRLDGRKR